MLRNGVLIFLAVGLYGLLHSLAASHTAKRWVRERLGGAAARGYRLAYNIVFTALLLPLLGLPAALPDRVLYIIHPPWVYATTALQIAGLALAADAVRRTDLWAFLGLRPEKPAGEAQLVARGAYRWVRHPMYTGSLLFIWLTPVMSMNMALFYAALTLYIFIGARFEERKLLSEYGEAYRAYRQEVPMLVPRWPRQP